MTRELGIIMSAESVNATLAGSMTMTRRVMRPQPKEWLAGDMLGQLQWYLDGDVDRMVVPRYRPGDLLYMKETWALIWPDKYLDPDKERYIEYRADNPNAPYPGDWPVEEARGDDEAPKWRSPLFMPRWAARPERLRVTAVRPERLQDITTADIFAEGIQDETRVTSAFAGYWDAINARRTGCAWKDNPMVWVYTFGVAAATKEANDAP